MEKFKVEISCGLCSESNKIEVAFPEGWGLRYDSIYEENGFCPKHKIISEWADSQCSGCVGGWGDCSLWSDFAFSGRRNMSDEDYKSIKVGICPKRTNGSFSFSREEGIKHIDLSEKGSTESGIALVLAIKEYIKNYPDK